MAADAPAVSDARGKEVYDAACFICHATGVAGAPKLGDSADWAPRIELGTELLNKHAIEGFMGEAGLMPPKGGRMDYSDDDVKAAVDYMVNNSQ
jgi:cytochrome c5